MILAVATIIFIFKTPFLNLVVTKHIPLSAVIYHPRNSVSWPKAGKFFNIQKKTIKGDIL